MIVLDGFAITRMVGVDECVVVYRYGFIILLLLLLLLLL
jgi:hypothetical protein